MRKASILYFFQSHSIASNVLYQGFVVFGVTNFTFSKSLSNFPKNLLLQIRFDMSKFRKYHLEHLIFWVGTITFHAIIRADLVEKVGWFYYLQEIAVRNVLLAGLIYINLNWLIPHLAEAGKYIVYGDWLLLHLCTYTILKNAHDMYLFGYIMEDLNRQYFWSNTVYNFSIALFYVAFSVALQLSKQWFFQRELLRNIQLEKLSTELDYLKSQINPHFVFNTLNTIYFQIDKSNTSAKETLLKFSELLRYQLYECNTDKVLLDREIAYLQNYIDLQRIRKDEENYQIEFNIDILSTDILIAPLLLIPFVENAFKHISHHTTQINRIVISIKVDNRLVLF
jgi:sensor histidine kinase YesM